MDEKLVVRWQFHHILSISRAIFGAGIIYCLKTRKKPVKNHLAPIFFCIDRAS